MPFILEPDSGYSSSPQLWIGTWSLGGEGFGAVDGRDSIKLLVDALHKGFRHFDSAQFYAHGKSEAYLAKAIKQSQVSRKEIFISSKGGLTWQGNQVVHDGSEKNLRSTLIRSLNAYQTDYLDLYQLHWPDPQTPLQESIKTLKNLQQEGLIKHWGIGNLSSQQLNAICNPKARIPHQVHHNPLHRSDDLLNAGHLGDRCYNCSISPLEQGLLTKPSYSDALEGLGKKDVRRRNPYFHSSEYKPWLRNYYQLSENLPFPRSILLLLWQLKQPAIDAVIVGPKRPAQLTELIQVLDHANDPRSMAYVSLINKLGASPSNDSLTNKKS
ncbi:MAG: aldo/keto reductase [Gammaproteobacteria bacterium]|nr:aldo/keto reductase [Gammaproteobacteria bacterium]